VTPGRAVQAIGYGAGAFGEHRIGVDLLDGHNPSKRTVALHEAVGVLASGDADAPDSARESLHAGRADPGVFADQNGRPTKTAHGNSEAESGAQLLETARAGEWYSRLEAQHDLVRAAKMATYLFQTPAGKRAAHRHT
jgi:hypothetical protein